ncbi:MAG: hypothetical protein HYT08_02435 [Candidatus Levybacteria bacterium]|nr:hypothetical protein [Candidatus Levybacteria bacterium]
MAARAETNTGINPEAVNRKTNGSLSHEDLNLLAPGYRELTFKPLKWLKIVDDISQLNFKKQTERHIKSNGHKSDGHYFLEQKINNYRIYGYVLKPEPEENGESIGRTSEHKHSYKGRRVVEHYISLIGSMDLVMDDENEESAKVVTLSSAAPHVMVPPETYHQAEISEGVAVVLVIMPDTADIPDEELHIPRQEKAA